jgi:2,3-bisphosphoglycerate-dependent phosphoglycerate mutase
MSKKLIIVRHGESLWNYQNKFTGWADIELTELGRKQAINSGKILLKNNIFPTISYTSDLIRSIDTNHLLLKQLNLIDKINVINSWRLNEKHYGKLTGYTNDIKWKGNYFETPPILKSIKGIDIVKNIEYNPIYGESYYMTFLRVFPLWNEIQLKVNNNEIPMLCAHKNSLKVLMQHIEKSKLELINEIDVPNAKPLIYFFDDNMNFVNKKYLE